MQSGGRALLFEERGDRECFQLWRTQIGGRTEYELMINGVFIMATYNGLSSELLVRNALERLGRQGARVLIGGLGLGFSVKEACEPRHGVRGVTVVEINPHVIGCNQRLLTDVNGRYLEDERVALVQDDFVAYIHRAGETFDIICMDIDNGPMLIVNEQNAKAYEAPFFLAVRRRLSPDGIFVIWSCDRDDALLETMKGVFPVCYEEEVFEEHNGRSVPYYLYFACVQG